MARRFVGKTVLITGASSGIGAATAAVFAAEGARLSLLARRADRLETLADTLRAAGGEVLTCTCDVTDRASIDAAVASTVETFGGLDVVLANAGFGVSGLATRMDTEDYRRQFETNVFGVIDTVYATLPHLLESRGRLGLVGSIMGRLALPASAPYCASKFAVVGFGEALYYDLHEKGVSVSVINPGIVSSEIRSVNNRGEYTGRPDSAPARLIMPAEKAAGQIMRGMHRRKPEIIITGHGKFGVFMTRHFPRTARAIIRTASKGRLEKIAQRKRAQS